ncbi:N-acyl homoserine lactonase family protein [Maribacter sp. PR1]|uniref:N-acyl homoserine lactonase family protein n=1 Tax=Maribacter cobaltidurans TaxID=1178778 RepID=A0ABU7J083_9FLAO|nr:MULTISPECIES: N-acyl homoserine lactonase family protein [Maribacter]MDC6390836.1 N-acyl homoserine lactonase family protein [Maribacter sp. PR1]MEE1978228.1 N-acyl homoserine lactonase family protein [Maribacter cobaltidurans]
MKKYFLLFMLVCLTFSCKEAKKEAKTEVAEEPVPEIKLYTFDGGTIMVNNLELFSQDTTYQGQTKEFADPFYVISHPKGTLMWDAGLPEMLVGQEPLTVPNGAFTVSRKDSVADQLKSIGLTPDDIDFIALSHTHFDHSGHANEIEDATWLVPDLEYDFVASEATAASNPELYDAVKELKDVQKIEGDYDVFEDGTVVIKSMPGHTPGHQVLFLDLPENGPTLLTGDLYHLYENREFKRVPIFNFDVEQTLASMDSFEAFAKVKDAKVYVQHQKDDFNKMPKAPEYLK